MSGEDRNYANLDCPHCGQQIHYRIVPEKILPPPPARRDGWILENLNLSVRSSNCLFFKGQPPLPRSADLADLLNLEYPQRMKNFGQKCFAEIVLLMQEQGGCSMERIEESNFWRTAWKAFQDEARFELQRKRWRRSDGANA